MSSVKKNKIRGKTVKKIRLQSELNMVQLGKKLGVGRISVYRYEMGIYLPPIDIASKYVELAHELGMSDVTLEDILISKR